MQAPRSRVLGVILRDSQSHRGQHCLLDFTDIPDLNPLLQLDYFGIPAFNPLLVVIDSKVLVRSKVFSLL